MLILFKMKTRWHHLVTYTASRSLPPPQPQLMSMPLSHCLVDCRVSPSSWPTTTIIVVVSILHLLASSSTPLLACVPPPSPLYCHAPFSVEAAYFSASSPSPPATPPPSPSPSYLHRILFDCCVLTVVVVVRCCLVSLSTPPPLQPLQCIHVGCRSRRLHGRDIAMCVGDIRTGDVLLNDGDKDWENWRRRRRRMRECGRRLHGSF